MTQTSIAIPTVILERLTREAKAQRRSRNNLIALILEDGVETFERMHAKKSGGIEPAWIAPESSIDRTFILNEETGDTKGVEITARASTVAPANAIPYKRRTKKLEPKA